jgi:pyruvate/2-oxoacid:ferredoxin oxidoreductase alpha subunit
MSLQKDMESVFSQLVNIQKRFYDHFGRTHQIIQTYDCEDASTILITCSTISGTARASLSRIREKGIRLGLMRLNLFRPFPVTAVRSTLSRAKKIAVIDRDISFGGGGILGQEIKAALYSLTDRPEYYGFIAGLGGKDVTHETIERIVHYTEKRAGEDLIWVDMD